MPLDAGAGECRITSCTAMRVLFTIGFPLRTPAEQTM
jgi:hypothetical protein